MASKTKEPKQSVDMSEATGSHVVETGIGAALGGAVGGMAVGAFGGPVGAVIGGVAGAVAGGLAGNGVGDLLEVAGKGVGGMFDPTTEDTWLLDYYGAEKDLVTHSTPETYRPAYRYGIASALRNTGKRYTDVEAQLSSGWAKARGNSTLTWDQARAAVRHAYERAFTMHEEWMEARKEPSGTERVRVHQVEPKEHALPPRSQMGLV